MIGGLKMEEWYPIQKAAQETGIPEPTLRRYIRDYKEFIKTKNQGYMQVIHFDSLDVLQKIRKMHIGERLSSKEVKERLAKEQPMNIVVTEQKGEPVTVADFIQEVRMIDQRILQENRQMKQEIYELRQLLESIMMEQSKFLQSNHEEIKGIRHDITQLSRKKQRRGLIRRVIDAIRAKEE
jgi:DNA-binding transcriptional MerR regulator